MDWKNSLDRYLTTEPEDGFSGWADVVLDKMSDDFYNLNEDWLFEYDGQCNKWLNKLFNKGKEYSEAAQIIERAHSIFIK